MKIPLISSSLSLLMHVNYTNRLFEKGETASKLVYLVAILLSKSQSNIQTLTTSLEVALPLGCSHSTLKLMYCGLQPRADAKPKESHTSRYAISIQILIQFSILYHTWIDCSKMYIRCRSLLAVPTTSSVSPRPLIPTLRSLS